MEKMKPRSAGGWGVDLNPAASHQSGSRERRVTKAQHSAMLLQRVCQMSQSEASRMEPGRDEELRHLRGETLESSDNGGKRCRCVPPLYICQVKFIPKLFWGGDHNRHVNAQLFLIFFFLFIKSSNTLSIICQKVCNFTAISDKWIQCASRAVHASSNA